MNDYQEEKLTSNKLVVQVARQNPEITRQIPDFEEGINRQDEINMEIDQIRILQEKETASVAENKKYTLKSLLSQTLDISGAVHSYAGKTNNILLMGKVDFKIAALSKMVPGKLISAAGTTLEEAKKVPATELANAGISAAELTAYNEIVEYFKTIINSPRAVEIDTSVYTKKLADLFKESNQKYKNSMDRLAHQFKTKAPEFYQKYRSARKAIHHGTSNTGTTPSNDNLK